MVSGNDSAGGLGTIDITGFASGDTIDLTGFFAGSDTFANNPLVSTGIGGAQDTLAIMGSFTSDSFQLSSDGNGGTDITLCYLRGTRIFTPTGALPVEDIAIGDLLVTRFSGMAKVKWIGRQSFDLRFVQNNRDRLPVRIRAGALGDKLPARDLYVSPRHSMLLEDTLVLARGEDGRKVAMGMTRPVGAVILLWIK